MGLLDKLGDQVSRNRDRVDDAIDSGGDFIDSKTGHKHADHVDKGQVFLKDRLDRRRNDGDEAAPRRDH